VPIIDAIKRYGFGLQTKVVFITILTGTVAGGLLVSLQIYQSRSKTVEIAKDRLRHDGLIVQQEILERGDRASEISKKIAISLPPLFERPNPSIIQKVIASFQNKNPGFIITIRTSKDFLSGTAAKEKFSNPDNRPTIFSALNGETAVSIEKTASDNLSIAASAPIHFNSRAEWIVHTEWMLTPDFVAQLRRYIDKELSISFVPFKKEETIPWLIQNQIAQDFPESILHYNKPVLHNPFTTIGNKGSPSTLRYYLPLINSHGTTLGAIQVQLEKSALFQNKAFFQFGVLMLLLPLLMGTLIFLLIKYMITAPIIQLSRVAKTIAVGNFSVALPQSRSNDEIGGLTSALGEMRQKIENKTTELTSLNDALFSQKKHLMKLNEELNQKNDYIASLVSTVSHELRTPMASIMGFSELLLNRKFSQEKQAKYLETIHLESLRLATILNDFLDIQKLESKDPGLRIEEIRCQELIETVLTRFPSSIYRQHKFAKIIPRDLPVIKVDHQRLIQVLINLISNAIKYSPQGGTVTVKAEQKEDKVLISVHDEGMGIPEENQEKIFTKFYRVDSSDHREIGGTGLGLSICKEIIELHGGEIWVESQEGEGTRFTFSLPIRKHAELSL
jgi:signal transduction histidine kinase